MSLYRLDYVNADGALLGAVRDPMTRGDYLSYRFDAARRRAVEQAALTPAARGGQRSVLVTKISDGGRLTPMVVAHPSGTVTRA